MAKGSKEMIGYTFIHTITLSGSWGWVRKVTVSGCHSSVAEHWQLKPEALGLTPGGTTFVSSPLLFQRSTDSNGPDLCLWLDAITIGLWTIEESCLLDSSLLWSAQRLLTPTNKHVRKLMEVCNKWLIWHTRTVLECSEGQYSANHACFLNDGYLPINLNRYQF